MSEALGPHVARRLFHLAPDTRMDGQRSKQWTFSLLLQVMAYSLACLTVSAFSRGLVDAARAEDVMDALRTLTEDNRQVSRNPNDLCPKAGRTWTLVFRPSPQGLLS